MRRAGGARDEPAREAAQLWRRRAATRASREVVEVPVEVPMEVVERILAVLTACSVLRSRAVCR